MRSHDPEFMKQFPDIEHFSAFLDKTFKGCEEPSGQSSAECKVAALNAVYFHAHRVIMYPQSYFANNNTVMICFSEEHMSERVAHFMHKNMPGCEMDASSITHQNVGQPREPVAEDLVANVYSEDIALWKAHCAGVPP